MMAEMKNYIKRIKLGKSSRKKKQGDREKRREERKSEGLIHDVQHQDMRVPDGGNKENLRGEIIKENNSWKQPRTERQFPDGMGPLCAQDTGKKTHTNSHHWKV